LPENVFFYPDTRQFRLNSDNFEQEGYLDMEMNGAIDYFIVPTPCPMDAMPIYFKLDIKKNKYKKKKCTKNNCPYDHPDYYSVVVLGGKVEGEKCTPKKCPLDHPDYYEVVVLGQKVGGRRRRNLRKVADDKVK